MIPIQNQLPLLLHIDPSITPLEETKRLAIIKYALARKKVIPYYQGLYNNQTHKIDKYEALMRICGPDNTVYAPGYFMNIAKKHGKYLDLNLSMLETVFQDITAIDCPVSLNLSPYHLVSQKFCDKLFSYLSSASKPTNIILEILEDECAIDLDIFSPFIEKARSYGVKIAIDDFGSGYSNLLAILHLQPDFLKIDGKIIKDVHNFFENEVIVEAVANIGQKLHIDLVAEFVENADIQEVIMNHGILYSQGYLFSKPQPFSELFSIEES